MKKTLAIIAIALTATTAQANQCLDNIGDYAKQDSMIKAWGIEKGTGNTIVFVQNVRNLKTIDISFYGFTDSMAKKLEESFSCKNVKFENAYTDMGLPRFNN